MSVREEGQFDVVMVGAGIMSATVATLLHLLDPDLRIAIVERLNDCAQESSMAWNNAGTGHAANCELNYTPQRPDGSVDITEALQVNTEFDLSRQLWAHLVEAGAVPDAGEFLHACPHMSFVWGEQNVTFLKSRHAAMSAHHCYRGMAYSEDPGEIATWVPLVMEGRDPAQRIAATRMETGTDVDYGALTHRLIANLRAKGVSVFYDQHVTAVDRKDSGWSLVSRDTLKGSVQAVSGRFLFIGAGGAAIELLQKSGIPEAVGYAGFPVSGIWLRCDVDALASQHHAKVYGKAASGSPPMSVPHLDTRIIDGRRSLLFGPYAGFSTRFLKHGSPGDLFESIRAGNIIPLLDVAKDNIALEEYLLDEVFQTHRVQFEALKAFFPQAQPQDWEVQMAGQRVQIIKPNSGDYGGSLKFGTELVVCEDRSLAALLGASPGASTAASVALELVKACFADRLTESRWLPKIRQVFPTFGIDLAVDEEACLASRARTAAVLGIVDINR